MCKTSWATEAPFKKWLKFCFRDSEDDDWIPLLHPAEPGLITTNRVVHPTICGNLKLVGSVDFRSSLLRWSCYTTITRLLASAIFWTRSGFGFSLARAFGGPGVQPLTAFSLSAPSTTWRQPPNAVRRRAFVRTSALDPPPESQQHGYRVSHVYKNKERPVIIIFIV
jgi:hypothetical protein